MKTLIFGRMVLHYRKNNNILTQSNKAHSAQGKERTEHKFKAGKKFSFMNKK